MKVIRSLKTMALVICCNLFAILSLLTLFELAYRYQLIDAYAIELHEYNDPARLLQPTEEDTVLVLGDSFTAGSNSYVSKLRAMLPEYRIVNSGVSAIGVIESNVMAPRRFREFAPDIFIYQIYVGNDLINIRYPIRWTSDLIARNIYGKISDNFRFIYLLNYRLAQLKSSLMYSRRDQNGVNPDERFSAQRYPARTIEYLKAEPGVFENQILLHGDRKRDYQIFLERLKQLVSYCVSDNCQAYLLVIPHASQVHPRYLSQMRQLGARFANPEAVLRHTFPFLEHLERAFADDRSVRVLNLLPVLQEHERANQPMYFANDPHLNDAGQTVLARFLYEHLRTAPP